MMNKTNELFNIYSRVSKTSVQWASFVHGQTIYHGNIEFGQDCNYLGDALLSKIIRDAPEWQFKLHCIVCESMEWSGIASFPTYFSPTNLRHNLVFAKYRAFACYDEEGRFLCEPTMGQNRSHTRWWRTRSTVLAHELG
jgi:hypothetical protein